MLKLKEAVQTKDSTKAKRLVYEVEGLKGRFIVVKLFDDVQKELWTVKVWSGDYEKTKAHWSTQEVFKPDEAQLSLAEAHIKDALIALEAAVKFW